MDFLCISITDSIDGVIAIPLCGFARLSLVLREHPSNIEFVVGDREGCVFPTLKIEQPNEFGIDTDATTDSKSALSTPMLVLPHLRIMPVDEANDVTRMVANNTHR